jgi:hypothetical protein
MANTAQMLRANSEALRKSLQTILVEFKKVNEEITEHLENNASSVEQLLKDNEELAVLKADNETFISKVEGILAE